MLDTFAQMYQQLTERFIHDADFRVGFACRGLQMARETSLKSVMTMNQRGISVFSCQGHRVTPIKFTLAELCWILAGRFDVESIASYNKAMTHFADEDGKTISGSYGLRLGAQLPVLIDRLKADIYTRQACAVIFDRTDCLQTDKTHLPCNVFLQFLCRPPLLDLHVTSRSSDFVTGFSIDTIHWQALLILMANELKAEGLDVIPNILHYNIASLHVYEADVTMVTSWDTMQINMPTYEHFIPLRGTLTQAIADAKGYFKSSLTVVNLADILNIPEAHHKMLQELDDLFVKHRNKVVR